MVTDTHKHTHRQDRLQYTAVTAPQLARSVTNVGIIVIVRENHTLTFAEQARCAEIK